MSLVEDMLKGMEGSGAGFAVGVGALLLAPVAAPIIGRALRPLAKSILRSGIVLYREFGEGARDLVAQARAEQARPS